MPGGDPGAGQARYVFATSTEFAGQLGGLSGADTKCQLFASSGGLPGTYKAWLADAAATPASRMVHGSGPYQLPGGKLVARNWSDLTDGTLAAPIDQDEDGAPVEPVIVCRGGEIWSNVAIGGGRRPGPDCEGWTRAIGSTGSGGNVGDHDAMWTEGDCPNMSCTTPLPIYCVQQ
jgi:hypothetical protein